MTPQLLPATEHSHSNGLSVHTKSHSMSIPLRFIRNTLVALVVVTFTYVVTARTIVDRCRPVAPVEASCPVVVQKKKIWKFWKKEDLIMSEKAPETETSSFCLAASKALEYLPLGTEPEAQTVNTECQPQIESKPKEHPLKRIISKFKPKKNKKKASQEADSQYHKAFTTELEVTPTETRLIKELSTRVKNQISETELTGVSWGGPGGPRWWWPQTNNAHHSGLHGLDGGDTLYSYLRIMHWPEDMFAHFPFKLCANGCFAERAIAHTVEWRDKYKPWLVTPSARKENEDGFVYTRGHSPAPNGDNSGHSMVWYRVGIHKVVDPEAYFRAILNTLDQSIADNLKRSHNMVGKYNVVMDGNHFRFSMIPNLNDVKRGIVMMQDHFPDRLGMVFIANLSKPGEILFNLITPFISKEVREKISLLPHDPARRQAVLESVVEKEFIPNWLGGTDTYEFNVDTYYPSKMHWTEKEGREYLQTMPYHA